MVVFPPEIFAGLIVRRLGQGQCCFLKRMVHGQLIPRQRSKKPAPIGVQPYRERANALRQCTGVFLGVWLDAIILCSSRNHRQHFLAFLFLRPPKLRLDSKFVHLMDQDNRLWQRILQSTSLTIATSLFDRSASPNFRLIILNVDSMLLLL